VKEFNQINLTPVIENTPNSRIGVVALSTDFTIEQDFRKICHMLPVDIFVNNFPNPLTFVFTFTNLKQSHIIAWLLDTIVV